MNSTTRRYATPTRDLLDAFLHHLGETGSVSKAARRLGLRRSTLYFLRANDDRLAERWDRARELGIERLKDLVIERAIEGIEQPVFRGDRQVGRMRHYDNRHAMNTLKAFQRHPGAGRPEGSGREVSHDMLRRLPATGPWFIPAQLVEAATARELDADSQAPLVMGVDVARFGPSRSAICLRRGPDARSHPIERHSGMDLMTLAERVATVARDKGVQTVAVDETGMGAGVVDRLRQLGVKGVIGVHFGAVAEPRPAEGVRPAYANRRAEMWGRLKDWLAAGGALPDDPVLRADLAGAQFGYNANGEIQLESKKDIGRRGLDSPDLGDALALTFARPMQR